MKKVEKILGIIGGSGLYDIKGLKNKKWVKVESAFGLPSDEILFAELEGLEIRFLPRHGRGHVLAPSEINYKANIEALKSIGVTEILSISAVGSLREDFMPSDFVLVDQFVDRTYARKKSFFEEGLVAHVSMANPVCQRNGNHLLQAAKDEDIKVHEKGTYLVMEGPQFSTKAESEIYRTWSCDVIGMTNMPEAKLAREAEICYTSVAMVTDFDCWHPNHDNVTVNAIIKVMTNNANNAKKLIIKIAPLILNDDTSDNCSCKRSLDNSIITSPNMRKKEVIEKLESILSRININT
ncbi:S-methyl-5'-thioadenosine phosphorylase [Cyclobacteriaceae bacterium]|nr:S-methyl-5'-thioadenosine phosphorylase [Cyclobacteriaceae bacterium]